ncbi:hypothetical protein LINPERPRIM_LOCUS18319 [Linum perenne]
MKRNSTTTSNNGGTRSNPPVIKIEDDDEANDHQQRLNHPASKLDKIEIVMALPCTARRPPPPPSSPRKKRPLGQGKSGGPCPLLKSRQRRKSSDERTFKMIPNPTSNKQGGLPAAVKVAEAGKKAAAVNEEEEEEENRQSDWISKLVKKLTDGVAGEFLVEKPVEMLRNPSCKHKSFHS